jgi:hypothetical protein
MNCLENRSISDELIGGSIPSSPKLARIAKICTHLSATSSPAYLQLLEEPGEFKQLAPSVRPVMEKEPAITLHRLRGQL